MPMVLPWLPLAQTKLAIPVQNTFEVSSTDSVAVEEECEGEQIGVGGQTGARRCRRVHPAWQARGSVVDAVVEGGALALLFGTKVASRSALRNR